jgi:hypothetical protein
MASWELQPENRDKRTRHPEEARSKFEAWVLSNGGSRGVSNLLGVHQVTVMMWMARKSIPSTKPLLKLLEISKGELTAQDIMDGCKP